MGVIKTEKQFLETIDLMNQQLVEYYADLGRAWPLVGAPEEEDAGEEGGMMGEIITEGHLNHEEINEILAKYAAKMWAAEARIAGAEAMMDAMVMETPVVIGPPGYQHVAYGLRIRPDGKTEISANTDYKLFDLNDGLQLQAHAKWQENVLYTEDMGDPGGTVDWDDARYHLVGYGFGPPYRDQYGGAVIGPPPAEGWWGDSEAWQADPVAIKEDAGEVFGAAFRRESEKRVYARYYWNLLPKEYFDKGWEERFGDDPQPLPLLTEEEIQTMWDDDAFASGRVHPDPMDYHERYIEVD